MFQYITQNWQDLVNRVARECINNGRPADAVKIIGVSKFQPPEAVAAAIKAGLRNIGENRVQEAISKRPIVETLLKDTGIDPGIDPSDITWHFVGRLQSNKAAKAVMLFDVIQSIDSFDIAMRVDKVCQTLGKNIDIMIEVNTSSETTKAGVAPELTFDLVKKILELENLKLIGLMTIGPLTEDENTIMEAFKLLRDLRDEMEAKFVIKHKPLELSMGMSGDYPLAIRCGATQIRVGTALFGPRRY